jgi:hypothetical protein
MKTHYSAFRRALISFSLGLATVYMIDGLRAGTDEIPVNLPEARSGEILTVYRKDQEWIFRDMEARRNLLEERTHSQYEYDGRRGCGQTSSEKEQQDCERSLQKARAFIWEHWRQRRAGYVIVKMPSADAESEAHIFIEEDADGRMRLVWTWERIATREGGSEIDSTADIYEVRYRLATGMDEDGEFRPGVQCLEFIDVNGDRRTL